MKLTLRGFKNVVTVAAGMEEQEAANSRHLGALLLLGPNPMRLALNVVALLLVTGQSATDQPYELKGEARE